MSVINPDEWDRTHQYVAEDADRSPLAAQASIFLALLDLARYGTVQWFPDTDPADVPWAPEPKPEWVRCVDAGLASWITEGKVYRALSTTKRTASVKVKVINDDGAAVYYPLNCFVPATADEATVTIDVPVAWARNQTEVRAWQSDVYKAVAYACREALTKAGSL